MCDFVLTMASYTHLSYENIQRVTTSSWSKEHFCSLKADCHRLPLWNFSEHMDIKKRPVSPSVENGTLDCTLIKISIQISKPLPETVS